MQHQPTKSLDITPIVRDTVDPEISATQNPTTIRQPEQTMVDEYAEHPQVVSAREVIARLPNIHESASPTAFLANQIVRPTEHSAPQAAGLSPLASPTMATATMPIALPTFPKVHKPTKDVSKNKRAKPVIAAVGSFVLLLALFKSQIIFSQISYLGNSNNTATTAPTVVASEVISPDSTLNIAKINVSAPVVFVPTTDEAQIQKALEGGVVHYGGTAEPGQKGNSVIVGHSSNDWWEPGNYKFVFVLLDKLVVGDTFSLNYKSTKYIYEVTEVKVVEPTDLSVLAPTTDPTVTLITCTPPGTSWKRLVIKAKQISPSPTAAVAAASQPTSSSSGALPSNAPSFFEQIAQFWNGIFGAKPKTTTAPSSILPNL